MEITVLLGWLEEMPRETSKKPGTPLLKGAETSRRVRGRLLSLR